MPDVQLFSPKQLALSIQLDLQKIQPYCGTPIARISHKPWKNHPKREKNCLFNEEIKIPSIQP
jgi:hypothetical protein